MERHRLRSRRDSDIERHLPQSGRYAQESVGEQGDSDASGDQASVGRAEDSTASKPSRLRSDHFQRAPDEPRCASGMAPGVKSCRRPAASVRTTPSHLGISGTSSWGGSGLGVQDARTRQPGDDISILCPFHPVGHCRQEDMQCGIVSKLYKNQQFRFSRICKRAVGWVFGLNINSRYMCYGSLIDIQCIANQISNVPRMYIQTVSFELIRPRGPSQNHPLLPTAGSS